MQEPEKSVDNMETQPMETMPQDSQTEPTSPIQPMQPLTPHESLSRASTQLDVNEHGSETFYESLEKSAEEECPTGDECVDVCPENNDEVLVVDSDEECAMSPPKNLRKKLGMEQWVWQQALLTQSNPRRSQAPQQKKFHKTHNLMLKPWEISQQEASPLKMKWEVTQTKRKMPRELSRWGCKQVRSILSNSISSCMIFEIQNRQVATTIMHAISC